eukprot:Skav209236  [mRNA]  locus=scaffold293:361318:368908:- [translate_table: standard]
MQPWRCRFCWKTRSADALFCNTCGPWQSCQDPSFNYKKPKHQGKDQWTYSDTPAWEAQPWQPPRSPSRPRNPPSDPKLKKPSKGKGKGKNKQGKSGIDDPPPWQSNATSSGAAGSGANQAPEPPMTDNMKALLKELRKQESTLSPDALSLLQATEREKARDVTKALHAAVARFGTARKKVQEARDARLTLHSAWRQYLQDQFSKWQKYLQEFNEQDSALEESIQLAEESYQQAKTALGEAKQSEGVASKAEEILDSDEDLADRVPLPVDSIKEGITEMAQSLARLKQKADESFEAQQDAKKFKADGGTALSHDFMDEWTALYRAEQLRDECIGLCANVPPPVPRMQRTLRGADGRQVHFSSSVEVCLGVATSIQMFAVKVPETALQNWPEKPWNLHAVGHQVEPQWQPWTTPEYIESPFDQVSFMQFFPVAPVVEDQTPMPHYDFDNEDTLEIDENDFPEYEDPEEDPSPAGDSPSSELCTSTFVHILGRQFRHVHMEWGTHRSIVRQFARAFGWNYDDAVDAYQVRYRPVGVSHITDVYLLRHALDTDGLQDVRFVLLDVVIHSQFTSGVLPPVPSRDRRMLTMGPMHRRSVILHLAGVDRYCAHHWHRCLVHTNGELWPIGDDQPRFILHGTLLEVEAPPPDDPHIDSCVAVWEAQHGPVQLWQDAPLINIQTTEVHQPTPWHLQILQAQLDNLVQAIQDTLPSDTEFFQPTTVHVWYLHHDHFRVCRDGRPVRFFPGHRDFLRALQEVWTGLFDPNVPFNSAVVNMDLLDGEATHLDPPHLLISQPFTFDRFGVILTRQLQGLHSMSSAFSTPSVATSDVIARLAGLHTLATPMPVHQVEHNGRILDPRQHTSITHGDHFRLSVQSPITPIEEDVSSMVQVEMHHPHILPRSCGLDMPPPQREGDAFQPGGETSPVDLDINWQDVVAQHPQYIRNLYNTWVDYAAVEQIEQGPVITIQTYWLHGRRHPKCDEPRPVTLDGFIFDYERKIKEVWDDLLDPHEQTDLYFVLPAPPRGPLAANVLAHVLIVQDSPPHARAIHLSALHPDHTIVHSAHFVPTLSNDRQLVFFTGLGPFCFRTWAVCHVWYGLQEIREDPHDVTHGMGFVIILGHLEQDADRTSFLQLSRATTTQRTPVQIAELVDPPQWLQVPIAEVHFLRSQLLMLPWDPPFFREISLDWKPSTRQLLQQLPNWEGGHALAFHFYTDGSFLAKRHLASAASFLVIEAVDGWYFGGYRPLAVWEPYSAPRAELTAIFGTLCWIAHQIGHSKHPCSAFHIHFDCHAAGWTSAGNWQPFHNLDLVDPNRALTHWLEQILGQPLNWHYVAGHSDDPCNDAADTVCWAVHNQQLVPLDLRPLHDVLSFDQQNFHACQWLWILEAALQGQPDAPAVAGSMLRFNVSAPLATTPDQTVQQLAHPAHLPVTTGEPDSLLPLCVCTANVLSLHPQEGAGASLGARAEDLAQQFTSAQLDCIGLQETRSQLRGYRKFKGFHILSSPATARGHGGIQFWIRTTINTQQGPLEVPAAALRAVHLSTQRLIVTLRMPELHALFIIDLSLQRPDHDAVCADLLIPFTRPQKHHRHQTSPAPPLPTPTAATDVHTHAALLQVRLQRLREPRPDATPRKQHMSEATWQMLRAKRLLRHQARRDQRMLRRLLLLRALQRLRRPSTDDAILCHHIAATRRRIAWAQHCKPCCGPMRLILSTFQCRRPSSVQPLFLISFAYTVKKDLGMFAG